MPERTAISRPLDLLAVAFVIPLAGGLLAGPTLESWYQQWTPRGLIIAVLLSLAALIWLSWHSLRKRITPRWPHPVWLVVPAAMLLRLVLVGWLPPDLTGFEELQMGGDAQRTIDGSQAPLLFRITTLLSATSLELRGNALADLRWIFVVLGLVSIALFTACLRRLNISWLATVFGVALFASLRWMVIGGGVADELFSSIVIELTVLLCLIGATTSASNRLLWSGACGIAAGLLAYEYDSYKMIVMLPAITAFAIALFGPGPIERRHAARSAVAFMTTFTLVAAPVLSSVMRDRFASPIMDGFSRNRTELDARETNFGSDEWLGQRLDMLEGGLRHLFGSDVAGTAATYAPIGDSLLPAAVGVLFLAGLIYGLSRPSRIAVFALAVAAVLMILVSAGLTANLNPGRLTPIIPILCLLGTFVFDRALQAFQKWSSAATSMVVAIGLTLTLFSTLTNVTDAREMSRDPATLGEFANSGYQTCLALALQPWQFNNVLIDGQFNCFDENDYRWLYPQRTFDSELWPLLNPSTDAAMPTPEPGTLLVVHRPSGLDEEQALKFAGLAESFGAQSTLREQLTFNGQVGTMTFCVECEPAPLSWAD